MRDIGWVCGGATAVVLALLDVLGPAGTLVVPAQTPDNRDPSRWHHAPVPPQWWPTIREHLPAFDIALTPSAGMGVIAERVRTWPGSVRSAHPQTSFAAVGAKATELMAGHALESQLGEDSPLARLEAADGLVLLLGVGYDACTAFHLAEYRQPDPPMRVNSCVVATPSGRAWVSYPTVALCADDFVALGEAFAAATGLVRTGRVGAATCQLFPVRAAVRYAMQWFPQHRSK